MTIRSGRGRKYGSVRAVLDTSTLFSAHWRRTFEQAARVGKFTAIWSPWIIAELNRVLVWRWARSEQGRSLSRQLASVPTSAKTMMTDPPFDV